MLTDLRLEQRRRASELSHRNLYLISFCVTCQATVPVGMNHPHVGLWQCCRDHTHKFNYTIVPACSNKQKSNEVIDVNYGRRFDEIGVFVCTSCGQGIQWTGRKYVQYPTTFVQSIIFITDHIQ